MKLWGTKMSKLVELTENDIKYLEELDLNLFKKSEMYFDYDLIMSMIEMTPAEIYDMEDGYNYRVISWFDDLLFTELEAFNGKDFVNELTGGKDTIKKRCPLNNKKSKEYEEYVTLKKVFAYSLKGIIEGKSDALDREYINGIMINDDAPREVKEFQEGLNKLTNGKSQEVGEYSDLIHLDDSVLMYERVWDDKEKPKIKDGTKLVDIIDVIILATHGEELDDYQKEIVNYLVSLFEADDLNNIIGRNISNSEENMVYLIFAAQALVDNHNGNNFSQEYKDILSKKKDVRNFLSEDILKDYKDSAVYETVRALDCMIINNIETVNVYDRFVRNTIYYDSRYSFLKGIDKESKEEVEKINNHYFDRIDFGKKVTYSTKKNDKLVTLGNRLTKEELAGDEEKIAKARETLLAEDKELADKKALADIVDKLIHKEDLSQEELDILEKNGINGKLSVEELKAKIAELVARIKELEDASLERNSKKETLLKASDVLEISGPKGKIKKTAKDLVGFLKDKVQMISDNKKTIIGRSLSGIAGGAVGSSLAFVLGPVGIVLVNAVVAPVITQAYAYANKLEADELSGEAVEIESIDKRSNKIVAKVNSFLRNSHFEKIRKLADFNMFAKLANSKNEKISKIFSNKTVLRNIAAGLTSALVAMDVVALSRVASHLMNKSNHGVSRPTNSGTSGNTNGTTGEGTTGDSNTVGSLDYADSNSIESVKIGDTIGTENKITVGYKTSYDAKLGVNPVKLNQDIMYDGSSVIKEAYYYQNGVMKKLAVEAKDLTQTIQDLGIDPSDVVVNLAKSSGEGRAWVTGEVAAKSLGLTLVP